MDNEKLMALVRTLKAKEEAGEEVTRDDLACLFKTMGLPPLPPEIAARLHEQSLEDVQELALTILNRNLKRLLNMCYRLHSRCAECAVLSPQGRDLICDECHKDGHEINELTIEVAALGVFTHAAFAPGSRASARREAQREERDALKKQA